MCGKREMFFHAVALASLLTVQAQLNFTPNWGSPNAVEREGKCDKTLSAACPGAADVIPFAYAPDRQKIDESCSAASAHFSCFKNYASTCDPVDVESLYFLTYLDVCDSSSPLYEGLRKSIKCMKIAEKTYNTTCAKPMDKLEAELTAFESKISDHGISTDDWEKFVDGLTTRQEVVCYLQRTEKCDEDEGTDSVDTVEELFNRIGTGRKISFLVENQAMVDTVLKNLNLEDDQKKGLRGKN